MRLAVCDGELQPWSGAERRLGSDVVQNQVSLPYLLVTAMCTSARPLPLVNIPSRTLRAFSKPTIMVSRSRQYIDLILQALVKWPNWDPSHQIYRRAIRKVVFRDLHRPIYDEPWVETRQAWEQLDDAGEEIVWEDPHRIRGILGNLSRYCP
ncbi:hypothetical protein JAAARDRAFT_45297 [Jaapia argillacea MUCL 33604]|uniref:Uncharacterized protein n=1 Tax=Jaapia argillacea MUCL 33604 TaxID=933084 RepID=A0A067QGS0_9AGAM|nr:hypothetical protein JAAARDRAFT_45297 [Jaapia argillacea MUCL 33604]